MFTPSVVIDVDYLSFSVFNFQDMAALTAGLEIDSLTGGSGRMTLRGIAHNTNPAAEAAVTSSGTHARGDRNAWFNQLSGM